jgi:phage-related protein
MGFVADIAKSVASIAGPILNVVKMIPGVGQIASIADTALSIVSNVDKAFHNFPKGLIEVAADAASKLLPSPIADIAHYVMNPGEALMGLVPQGVLDFMPAQYRPQLPAIVNDLVL